jgi:hypothetical protein
MHCIAINQNRWQNLKETPNSLPLINAACTTNASVIHADKFDQLLLPLHYTTEIFLEPHPLL